MPEQLKPMSEAPKDGTEIVVIGPDSDKPYAVIWSDNFRTWQTSHAWFDADEPIGWLPLIQAIPPTHRIVSVELLERLTDHQHQCFCNGHEKCQLCRDFAAIQDLINKE